MIGLYYPYIHFREESWLKQALIYWDKVARIVPESFVTHDSDDVRKAMDELGAVVNAPPYSAGAEVAHDFVRFVREHAQQLRKKYGVRNSERWKPVAYTRARAPEGTDARFGYIFHEKLGNELAQALTQEGLAVWGEGRGSTRDMRWIGVHPKIAGVYMTAMAEAIAKNSGYRLISDDVTEHVVVGERSIDRLSEMLLKDSFLRDRENLGSSETVAIVAIRTVLPRNLAAVPMSKIIEFRLRFAAELEDFQKWTFGVAKELTDASGGVSSPMAMIEHMELVEKGAARRLAELKKQLNSLSIQTVTGCLSIKSPWNITGTSLAYYLSEPALAVGGIALTAVSNFSRPRGEAKKMMAGNPAAYLMRVAERLGPPRLANTISAAWRKITLGV